MILCCWQSRQTELAEDEERTGKRKWGEKEGGAERVKERVGIEGWNILSPKERQIHCQIFLTNLRDSNM